MPGHADLRLHRWTPLEISFLGFLRTEDSGTTLPTVFPNPSLNLRSAQVASQPCPPTHLRHDLPWEMERLPATVSSPPTRAPTGGSAARSALEELLRRLHPLTPRRRTRSPTALSSNPKHRRFPSPATRSDRPLPPLGPKDRPHPHPQPQCFVLRSQVYHHAIQQRRSASLSTGAPSSPFGPHVESNRSPRADVPPTEATPSPSRWGLSNPSSRDRVTRKNRANGCNCLRPVPALPEASLSNLSKRPTLPSALGPAAA